jgi:hypothetical protein
MKKKGLKIMLFLMALVWTGCHKETNTLDPIISNEEMTAAGSLVRFSWCVDYTGEFQTGIELSQDENMTDLRRVEATKVEDKFVVVFDGLSMGVKYYYRIVVWNKLNNYVQEIKSFTIAQTFTVTLDCFPEEAGTTLGGGIYAKGDTCTVTAIANNGHNFVNWVENGSQVSVNANYSFIVTDNRNLVAHFTSQEYTITASAEPGIGGTVSGSGGYSYADQCILTATPNEGYSFVNWTKDNGSFVTSNPSYTFAVTETATYVAHFQIQYYTISVAGDPVNGGIVEGDGIYEYGQYCTVTAVKADGYSFLNWTENGEQASSDEEYTFTVTRNCDLVAHFQVMDYTVNVSAEPSAGGVVSGGGNVFHFGDQCTLTATANKGYNFVNWTKADGTQIYTNPYTFTVTESASFVAHFQPINYTISVSAEPADGGIVTSGGNSFHFGDQCRLTAVANNGFTFSNWMEDGEVVYNEEDYTFTITGNRTLVANFLASNISTPTVTTTEITNVTQATAIGGGEVTADGGATVTERGVCWSTNHDPTISDDHASNGSNMGIYTINLTGLTSSTQYYARAYATNSEGTSYGNEVPFFTHYYGYVEFITISVVLSDGTSPEGTIVSFVNYNPLEQQNYPMQPWWLDETGFLWWDSFRMGCYQITIEKEGYETIIEDIEIWENNYSISFTLNLAKAQ